MMSPQQKSLARLEPEQGFTSKRNLPAQYNTSDPIQEFLGAMQVTFGYMDMALEADGTLHRFRVPGDKPGTKNGWYILFNDGRPAGAFGSWKTGQRHCWSAAGQTLEAFELENIRSQTLKAKKLRTKERAERHRRGALEALARYSVSKEAKPDHFYLKQKRTPPFNLRQIGTMLLVPMINTKGELVNVQRIIVNGDKRFWKGAQVTGAFSLIGVINPEGRLYVCEGWATGATIHQHSGDPVACAMNCGNLPHVITALRCKYPQLEIIIAGDDDRQTDGNPGRTKATNTAIKAGLKVVFPEFCRTDCSCTDFNDLHCCRLAGGA